MTQKYLAITFIFICFVGLTACSPELETTPVVTPEPETTEFPVACDPILIQAEKGLTYLQLPDGSEIYMADETEIKLTIAGYCPGITEHTIILIDGQVAIHSLLSEGSWFYVSTQDGYIAQTNDMGFVSYNSDDGFFVIDCISGNCAIGPDILRLSELACGESGKLDKNGLFEGPSTINLDALEMAFGSLVKTSCAVTELETPTPDADATATAYCATFDSQFPSTPCPSILP